PRRDWAPQCGCGISWTCWTRRTAASGPAMSSKRPRRRSERMLSDVQVKELRGIVGADQVHAAPGQLIAYSLDGTFAQDPPDVALTPASTDEVAAIVRYAVRERLPLVLRGAGTSLAGGAIPIGGGILLSLARMNRIVEIDTANAVAVVQPGVVTADLQAAVEQLGL